MEKTTRSKSGKTEDAIALLTADHKTVKQLFKQFEKIKDEEGAEEERAELANQICMELTIHTQIEEEIFYPACREAIEEGDLLDEAEVEHASAKDLISQIESMQPEDELFAAKVTVLGEYVNHHIEEEEGELFPQVKKAKLDTEALAQEMIELKEELQSEVGVTMAPPAKTSKSSSKSSQSRKSSH
ncbi:MAG TPA: hemerythrin domain-containing protein [Methylophilaceae bacterium]|nr:hemerythrin domain-containing protein [Methylophilaceae bacterium]